MNGHYRILLLILVVASFFRFSRNEYLQYWNNDEEIHAWTVQRMIELGRPALVSPQPTLGTSIGSFFHIASVPLFLISGMDPTKIAFSFSIFGLGTTIAIYYLGKEVSDRPVGYIAAFLYASSFMASLYDRRWWPITLTPLLSTVGFILLIKMAKQKSGMLLPFITLIIATGFHGDPAMLIFGLFVGTVLIFCRTSISFKQIVLSLSIMLVFILPLIVFEFKHPSAITGPFFMKLQQSKMESSYRVEDIQKSLWLFGETVRLLILPVKSVLLEQWFFPIPVTFPSQLNVSITIVITGLICIPFVHSLLNIKREKDVIGIRIMVLCLVLFYAGSIIFSITLHHETQRVYFTVLFPIVFVLLSVLLIKTTKHAPIALGIFLISYGAWNTAVLLSSRLRYSLPLRWRAVQETKPFLLTKNFSFSVVGDSWLGMSRVTNLYTMAGFIPQKSYIYPPLDWLLRSHSLYFTEPTDEDGEQIVIMSPVNYNIDTRGLPVIFQQDVDVLGVTILDNSGKLFARHE